MAEHMIESRILLRYDTLTNWMASTLILKQGEVAVAKIPYGTTITSSDNQPLNTPPAIGLKVGDGHSYFSELPWVQAVAGDVYTWAKQATKPTYNANEIQDLAAFVEQHSGGGSGGGSGGDTPVAARIYQLVQGTEENANKYYLQYRTADSNEWITDTSHYIDLSQLSKLLNWIGDDLNDYYNLGGSIYQNVYDELRKINVADSYEEGKVVVAVEQNKGKIIVDKRSLNLNNFTGPLSVSRGGTGLSSISDGVILVGNGNNSFTTKYLESSLDDTDNLATNHAIKLYVDNKTAGLTGAMHFIGEATVEINPTVNPRVNPQIPGYNFNNAQNGDVILQNNKEFVWADGWTLLGDEGSYAVKGSIIDADISPEANISQSKILNLTSDLDNKVTIIEGKGLSTNDFTNEHKIKLEGIEEGAQVNAIEHIFVNDVERPITIINGQSKSIALSIDVFDEEHATKLDGIQAGAQVNAIEHIFVNGQEHFPTIVNNLTKSVSINFNPFTTELQTKLEGIESGAQVNKIEKIYFNDNLFTANEEKEVRVTLDAAALNLTVLEGAQVPYNNTVEEVPITNKKLQLARIAATGNVSDLKQTANTYIIFNCGSSTEVI